MDNTELTKLEAFAKAAMQGLLANGSVMRDFTAHSKTLGVNQEWLLAKTAVLYANELLAALEARHDS